MRFVDVDGTGKLCLLSNHFAKNHDLFEQETSEWLHFRRGVLRR